MGNGSNAFADLSEDVARIDCTPTKDQGKADNFVYCQMRADLPAETPEMVLVYIAKSFGSRKETQKVL
eukprot:6204145-Pleurochrysis_carterae.AAC.1